MRDRRDYQKKTSQRLAVAAMSVLPYAVIFAVVCVSWSLGVLGPIDRFLMDQRFWIIEREASGGLALVAIDPQSLKEEDQWPWPRDRYATAVINLQNAGAALVGFDVDFSSLSDPLGDAAFADALARRPGDVILPVFSQQSVEGGVVTTPPNSFFMQDAVIASVNLTPEKNGLVRQGWRGVQEGDAFRGSMASVLAGTAGASNERFYIDFSIDPASIPRLSFNDVLRNDFPAELVSGKKVIIGATALELGDEFAAPTRGVLPGVVLHVLSYESLVQGRTISRLHFCVPLLLALGVVIWFVSRSRTWSWPGFMARNAALFAILIAAPLALQAAAPVSLDTGAMLLAQMLCVVFVTGKRINQHAVQIIRQRAATAHYQALTRLVVQDSADGVIVTDDSGVIELLSPRAQALLGLDAPTEAGGFLQDYVDEFPLQTPPDGETVTTEFTVAGEDARTLEILSTSAGRMLDSDGKSTTRRLVVYTLRDVSIRKRIEAAERKAKEAAIAADAMKTQLISNMSHELRTPLNGIIGFAGMLRQEAHGPLGAAEYAEYSRMIHDSGKRLSALVTDMLTVAKLDAGEYELDRQVMSASEIIECCVDDFKRSHDVKNRSISMECEKGLPDVNVDVPAFGDMIGRLLQNSLKFTGDDGHIRIRAKRDGAAFLLEVVDNGCGVDPALLPKLKELFYQGDGALNRQHEGAGLGLFIVSEVASLHGGVLELRSKPGAGFLARLRFPDMVHAKQAKQAA